MCALVVSWSKAMRCAEDGAGFRWLQTARMSSSKTPDLLWGPPNLLFNRLRRLKREADHLPSRSGAIPAPPFMTWTLADDEEVRRSDGPIDTQQGPWWQWVVRLTVAGGLSLSGAPCDGGAKLVVILVMFP